MKKIVPALFAAALVFFGVSSFQSGKNHPSQVATEHFVQRFKELKTASDKWLHAVSSTAKPVDTLLYYQLRDAFKRCEFIWEFQDPIFVKEYINGAPLPKLDKAAPSLIVLQPKGLQVLDELLFSEMPDRQEIIAISRDFNNSVQGYEISAKLYDRTIFDALRVGLVRHFNMGLTGFDLPGSDRALADGMVLLEEMSRYLKFYEQELNKKEPGLAHSLLIRFEVARKKLSSSDFESLDRLEFLMNAINPLFDQILKARHILEIETQYESAPGSRFAFNFESGNLFAADFLNPLYYVSFPSGLYTPEAIELGRTLFFDPILSSNNERSCASCHQPEKGFSDGLTKSLAFNMDGHLQRNSPGLINAVYSERFFHDLRAEAFEDQMEHVVFNQKEFNHTLLGILDKLVQSPEYIDLFRSAYPASNNPVNQQNLSFAISAYVSSLQSFDSPFDQFVRHERDELDPAVRRGFNLFMGKAACGTCHFAPVFNGTVPPLYTESESEVLGVPALADNRNLDTDPGRYGGKLKEKADFYLHSFKTPGLRNVELTAPYMHNGVYATLEQVMDFYNRGGGTGLGFEVPYQTLPPDPLNLSPQEISDIILFMKALTDADFQAIAPEKLPAFPNNPLLNQRQIGGVY